MPVERCSLCNFPLDERAVVISEGKLCHESVGCRRRALKLVEHNRGVLTTLIDYLRRHR